MIDSVKDFVNVCENEWINDTAGGFEQNLSIKREKIGEIAWMINFCECKMHWHMSRILRKIKIAFGKCKTLLGFNKTALDLDILIFMHKIAGIFVCTDIILIINKLLTISVQKSYKNVIFIANFMQFSINHSMYLFLVVGFI